MHHDDGVDGQADGAMRVARGLARKHTGKHHREADNRRHQTHRGGPGARGQLDAFLAVGEFEIGIVDRPGWVGQAHAIEVGDDVPRGGGAPPSGLIVEGMPKDLGVA